MSATPESQSDDEKRAEDRRRMIDLTRREKGLPERRKLGTDRRMTTKRTRPVAPADGPLDEVNEGSARDTGDDPTSGSPA